MKHILIAAIAAVLLVGCGESQSPKPPTAKAPDINIHKAAQAGNIEAVKQHLAAGTDVNAKYEECATSLDWAKNEETADLLRKRGGKTWNELKAAGK